VKGILSPYEKEEGAGGKIWMVRGEKLGCVYEEKIH